MATVVVLRDIEATADGAELPATLDGLAPRCVTTDFGGSSVGRAMLALPALDAAVERFPKASFDVRGATDVVRLLTGHLGGRAASANGQSDLVLDFCPAIRKRPVWYPGSPPRLALAAAPYPTRPQHASEHWADAARAAGFAPKGHAPRLQLPRGAFAAAREVLSRLAPRAPVVVLISNGGDASPRAFLAEVGRMLGERIGAKPIALTHAVPGIPAFPSDDSSVRAAACTLSCVTIGDAGGFSHVAAAAGAPTLALHGRSDPERQGPVCKIGASAYATCKHPALHRPSRARGSRCLRCLDLAEVVRLAEELAARRWPWDWFARWGGS